MANIKTLLFGYTRMAVSPFETFKIRHTPSMYSTSGTVTISPSLLKALIKWFKINDGSDEGSIGKKNVDTYVSEYKSSTVDRYYLTSINGVGTVSCSIWDTSSGTFSGNYILNASKEDGAAILFTLLPLLMKDTEFSDNLVDFENNYHNGFTDLDKSADILGRLSDNVFRRLTDTTCSAYIELSIPTTGNIPSLNPSVLKAKGYEPDTIICGLFHILSKGVSSKTSTMTSSIPPEKFDGKYCINPSRNFTYEENFLKPTLPSYYVVPDWLDNVCKHAKLTTDTSSAFRNFMLRGPAGTGKTMGAKGIAAGLGLPYVVQTCGPGSEQLDFIGQLLPNLDNIDKPSDDLVNVTDLGGIKASNIITLLNLPSVDDLTYDLFGSYEKLTGKSAPPNCDFQTVLGIMLQKVVDKAQELTLEMKQKTINSNEPSFRFIEAPYLKAIKNGWACEIQEPTVIVNPATLVALNSMMELDGKITLITGETITRHKDCVIILTTNIEYEGCRNVNQSIMSRMNLVVDVKLPDEAVLVERAMKKTGCTDKDLVTEMVSLLLSLDEACKEKQITDGSCGPRELKNWIVSTMISDDPYNSAITTLFSKVTNNLDDMEFLITTVLDNSTFLALKKVA